MTKFPTYKFCMELDKNTLKVSSSIIKIVGIFESYNTPQIQTRDVTKLS
jgi:hypothetical protein